MAPASGGIPVVSIFYFFYFLGKVNTTSVASFLYNIMLIYEKKLCRRDHVLFTLFAYNVLCFGLFFFVLYTIFAVNFSGLFIFHSLSVLSNVYLNSYCQESYQYQQNVKINSPKTMKTSTMDDVLAWDRHTNGVELNRVKLVLWKMVTPVFFTKSILSK